MTIVETTASSEPSAISGTESAEATTVVIHGNRSRDTREACRLEVDCVDGPASRR